MKNLSVREAEALVLHAARGAGYPWGMAQEAGYAAGWLVRRKLCDPGCMAELLQDNCNRSIGELGPQDGTGVWQSANGALCPIVTGAYLSDCARLFEARTTIHIRNLAFPVLMLPFAAAVSARTGAALKVAWDALETVVSAGDVKVSGGCERLYVRLADPVRIASTDAVVNGKRTVHRRLELSDAFAERLGALAYRIHVPETEQLMSAGAGGERIDDE